MKHYEDEGLVYVAAPYTDANPDVMEARRTGVDIWTAALIREGIPAISPLTYELALKTFGYDLPSAEHWYRFDRQLMQTCDRLIIMALPGWEKSRGVSIEIHRAQRDGMPIQLNGMDERDRACLQPYAAVIEEEDQAPIVQVAHQYAPGPDNEAIRREAAERIAGLMDGTQVPLCVAAYRMTVEMLGGHQSADYWRRFAAIVASRADRLVVTSQDSARECAIVREDTDRMMRLGRPIETLP